jgi:alkanesulfonate monooxygenase SsuD/methylene tetrahydromethanopterin reductase-like flavin-dependent oxidoreductase (luciferase family)
LKAEVRFGATLPQFTADGEIFLRAAHRAEELELDSIWVFDHLWPLSGGKERPILEGWTALAAVASETSEVGVGTLVTRSSLRHPALLAKMAATVAEVAPGRLTVAIGSGDEMSRDENESFGIPYYEADERIGQLESTVRVVSQFLSGHELTHEDDFVSLDDLPPSPVPERAPTIWVGGRSDDALTIAARWAHAWNGWAGPPERYAQDAQRVIEMAQGRGRAIELTWATTVFLGRDDAAAREKLGKRSPARFVVGGPDEVARELLAYVEGGARHLVLSFPDAGDPETLALLAGPVRDAVLRG